MRGRLCAKVLVTCLCLPFSSVARKTKQKLIVVTERLASLFFVCFAYLRFLARHRKNINPKRRIFILLELQKRNNKHSKVE